MHAIPAVIITLIECLGLWLLAREVWLGHKVEGLSDEIAPQKRLQYLYTTGDYRGFWLEYRLQRGDSPAKAQGLISPLTPKDVQDAVEDEWSGIAPELSRAFHRLEEYTTPSVRRRRRVLLWTGTSFVIVAALLHLFPELMEKHDSGGEVVHELTTTLVLSAVRHQLSPVETGQAESHEDGCRLALALNAEGSNFALIVGRHDPRPLSSAATQKYGSNLGLAQRRAEALAALIESPKNCPGVKPVETVAVAVPNDKRDKAISLDDQRRPDIIGLRVVSEERK